MLASILLKSAAIFLIIKAILCFHTCVQGRKPIRRPPGIERIRRPRDTLLSRGRFFILRTTNIGKSCAGRDPPCCSPDGQMPGMSRISRTISHNRPSRAVTSIIRSAAWAAIICRTPESKAVVRARSRRKSEILITLPITPFPESSAMITSWENFTKRLFGLFHRNLPLAR